MKNMPSVSVVLILALVLAAPVASAARKQAPAPTPVEKALKGGASKSESGPVGKGDTEFGFGFDYVNYEDQDTNQVTLTASVGKLVSDRLEISIDPTITWLDSGGFSSFSLIPFVGVKYLIRGANLRNPVVPYVGAGIGIDLTSSDSGGAGGSTFTYGLFVAPVAGLKAFVSERTSLEYAVQYNVGVIESCDSYDCFSGSLLGLNNVLRFNIYY